MNNNDNNKDSNNYNNIYLFPNCKGIQKSLLLTAYTMIEIKGDNSKLTIDFSHEFSISPANPASIAINGKLTTNDNRSLAYW